MPLATFPYLTRTLGPSEFGVLGVAAAIAAYCGIVTEWGFNLSGPRAVVECRGRPGALNELIWSTVSAKACLCLLSGVVLVVAFMLSASLATMKSAVFFSWLAVVGNVLTLSWLFQGLERFSLFATVSLAGRFLTLPLTFVFVKDSSDTAIAAAIQAASPILTGVFSFGIIWRMGLLGRPASSWRLVYERLVQGAQTFVSTASVSLFGATNAMILGYVGGTHQVGIYAAADKLKTVGNMIPAQINTVLYPRIARLFADDQRAAAYLTVVGASATAAVTAAGVLFCEFWPSRSPRSYSAINTRRPHWFCNCFASQRSSETLLISLDCKCWSPLGRNAAIDGDAVCRLPQRRAGDRIGAALWCCRCGRGVRHCGGCDPCRLHPFNSTYSAYEGALHATCQRLSAAMFDLHVISLQRSNRRETIAAVLGEHGVAFRIEDALDARTLTDAQFEQLYDDRAARERYGRSMTRAEVACFLSHRSVWKRIADSGRAAVVLEDDATFDAPFFDNFLTCVSVICPASRTSCNLAVRSFGGSRRHPWRFESRSGARRPSAVCALAFLSSSGRPEP